MTDRSPRGALRFPNDPPRAPLPKPFRILALSGGGYRGLFSAEVAALLDDRWDDDFSSRFDLFAGTSIGGLVAAGLAIGKTPRYLSDAIKQFGPQIFDDRFYVAGRRLPIKKWRGPMGGAFVSKFKRDHLKAAIDYVLGDEANEKIRDVERPLLIVAACATTKSPFIMTNLSDERTPASDMCLRDALLATSAAPGYFPALDLPNRSLVDGGLVANAPDLVAVTEVVASGRASPDTVRVLSIGTASPDAAGVPAGVGRRGLGKWLVGDLVPLTLEAQERLIVHQASTLLRNRFRRIDAPPGPAQAAVVALDLATPQATRTLLHLAEEALNRISVDELSAWLEAPLSASEIR